MVDKKNNIVYILGCATGGKALMMQSLGDYLRILRKKKGKIYSQTKVAHDLGKISGRKISKSTISNWELNSSIPDIHMLKHLARYYCVSVDYLLGLVKDPMTQEAFNPAVKYMREIMSDLDSNSKDFLNRLTTMFYETIIARDKERETHSYRNPVDFYELMIQASIEIENLGEDMQALKIHFMKSKGLIYQNRCDYYQALKCYEQAYQISCTQPEDPEIQEELLNKTGHMYLRMGRYRLSLSYYEQALALAQDNVREGVNRLNIGILHEFLGNFEEAICFIERAYKLFQSSNAKKYFTNVYHSLGLLYFKTGNYSNSLFYFQKALELAESRKDLYRKSLNLNGIGLVYEKIGCFELAVQVQSRSLEIARLIEHKRRIGQQYFNLGVLKNIEGKYIKSIDLYNSALELFSQSEDLDGQAEIHAELARSYIHLNDTTAALNHLEKARALATKINDPEFEAVLHMCSAEYYQKTGNIEKLMDSAGKAIDIVTRHNLPSYEYYLFRAKQFHGMKMFAESSDDMLKCIENVENIMKHIPKNFRDNFEKLPRVMEAYKLMKIIMEISQ